MRSRAVPAVLVSSTLLLVGASARADEPAAPSMPVARRVSELSTRATRALVGGDYERALTTAEVAITLAPRAPWPHYERAVALAHLGAVHEAITEFQKAEARFAPQDRWGRSVAIYGRAHALAEDGDCAAADEVYARYAVYVRADDPIAAERALGYARDCRLPGAPEVATGDVRLEEAELALATAQGKEDYARSVERWARQAEASLVADPGAQVKLDRIRGRALALERTAALEERQARTALEVERRAARPAPASTVEPGAKPAERAN